MTQLEQDCFLRLTVAFERIASALDRAVPKEPTVEKPLVKPLTEDALVTVTPRMRAAWAREDLDSPA